MNLGQCVVCETREADELDHVIPRSCGGTVKWPLCMVCHDMIDRIPLRKWDRDEALACIQDFWTKCGPDGRMWMLKLFKVACNSAETVDRVFALHKQKR